MGLLVVIVLGLLAIAAEQAVAAHGTEEIVQRFRERLRSVSPEPGSGDDPIDLEPYRRVRFEVIKAQREALLAARDDGTFSAHSLTAVLDVLDAEQISMELRGMPGVG